MELLIDYGKFQIHAYWSKKVSGLVSEITGHHAKSYATQHDIVLKFVNDNIFQGKGVFNKEFRKKGKTYPDLKISATNNDKGFDVVELRVHTSQLKYLRNELKKREKTFSNSDHLYFTYFLQVGLKEKGKVLKDKTCIYYLVIVKLSSKTQTIPIKDLVAELKMGTEDFAKKLAKESGIEEEKEELLGVENMIKVVDLEREVRGLKEDIEEKDKKLNEKDKKLNEKEKVIDEKDKKLNEKEKVIDEKEKVIDEKDKKLIEKDKEIEQLKARLKSK